MTVIENYLTRQEIIDICSERDGYFCYLCEMNGEKKKFFDQSTPGRECTIEHVLPLARGGTWDIDNLKLAHRSCNQEKGDRIFLDDGTLEPMPVREGYAVRRANKERILSEYCELCANGRLLMPEEYCPDCFRGATKYTWSMKRQPKDCSHSGYEWCWMDACGIIERVPAFVYVLDGEFIDE